MQILKATLLVQTILSFLCTPVVCWVGQISSRREGTQIIGQRQPTTTTTTSPGAGQLFYRNDNEEEFAPVLTQTSIISQHNLLLPKPIDLPRHSPPRSVIARTKMMLDMEMIVGRIAMISFFLFLAGEILTGLSATQLLTSLFLW